MSSSFFNEVNSFWIFKKIKFGNKYCKSYYLHLKKIYVGYFNASFNNGRIQNYFKNNCEEFLSFRFPLKKKNLIQVIALLYLSLKLFSLLNLGYGENEVEIWILIMNFQWGLKLYKTRKV